MASQFSSPPGGTVTGFVLVGGATLDVASSGGGRGQWQGKALSAVSSSSTEETLSSLSSTSSSTEDAEDDPDFRLVSAAAALRGQAIRFPRRSQSSVLVSRTVRTFADQQAAAEILGATWGPVSAAPCGRSAPLWCLLWTWRDNSGEHSL